jgi:S1-C subfamily serine protease
MKRVLLLILVLVFAVRAPAQGSKSAQQAAGMEAPAHRSSVPASTPLTPSQIFSRARPSVVVIVASDQKGQREALGSGFIVSTGRIATNHHVVEGMNEAYVVFSDGDVKPVSKVIADSTQQDLIILAVETGKRSALMFGDELSLQQGDSVYALGAPKGLELSFTNGIVSSFRKSNAQFLIQTTAPIAPGSSGGPLFDHTGSVVGVTASMLSDAPGIYFSVGIGDVKRLLRTPQGVALPFDEWAKQQGKKSVSESSHSIASNDDQTGQTPTLQETVSWMTSFLDAHGQEWTGGTEPLQSNSMGLSQPYLELLQAASHSDLAGKEACAIFVRHNMADAVQLHDDVKLPTKTWAETMFLADLDPSTIKVVARTHVHFETRNNLDKIVEIVPAGDKFSEYDLNLGNFILDSAENAERFASALKHAVNLCGGGTSPF